MWALSCVLVGLQTRAGGPPENRSTPAKEKEERGVLSGHRPWDPAELWRCPGEHGCGGVDREDLAEEAGQLPDGQEAVLSANLQHLYVSTYVHCKLCIISPDVL